MLSNYRREHALDWSQYQGTHWAHPTDTSLQQADVQRLAEKFTHVPADFKPHPTVKRVIEARQAMSKLAAENIIAVLSGKPPLNPAK